MLRLRLVVNVEGAAGSALWQRRVERPYPGVPRPADWVFLGEGSDGDGLAATPVAVVTWDNDGTVALRFDVAATGGDDGSYLELLGFSRVSPS
jgi:hypothetical protein